jgi:hypothetical protein
MSAGVTRRRLVRNAAGAAGVLVAGRIDVGGMRDVTVDDAPGSKPRSRHRG